MQNRISSVKSWGFLLAFTIICSVPSFAQTPPGQFTRFWRNFFESKGSWPTLRVAAAQGDYAYGMGVATLVGSTGMSGAVVGLGMVGQVADGLNSAMAGMGINPKEPPRILSVERTAQGVNVVFDDPLNPPSTDYFYQLVHFENANARPRLAGTASPTDFLEGSKWIVTDTTPPQSGVSFYVMTTTTRISGKSDYAESKVLMPWWSIPLSGSNVAYFAWLSGNKFGITSDYSAPVPYAAGATPNLGNVDTIAVSPLSQNVFVSRPLTRQITKMTNFGEVLGEEGAFISIPYKSPGQKGLAADSSGNLYTDNSASDSQFGGRLFKFNAADGSMTFTGTVNYFSQLLMYANPVMVGPMVMGPDGQLYVYDAMSRSVKAVAVNAAYEAGRRVGQPFFSLDSSDAGDVIDMEFRDDSLQSNSLFILEGQDVIRVFSDAISETKSVERIPLE